MRETNKVKSLMLVSISVLEEDGATIGKEVKGGLNTSVRSVKNASSTKLNSKRKKDSQSSERLTSSLREVD